jgi:hypothetical protein
MRLELQRIERHHVLGSAHRCAETDDLRKGSARSSLRQERDIYRTGKEFDEHSSFRSAILEILFRS